jgi:SAM-dependent methyltransferase
MDIARAYDGVAPEYDRQVRDSQWMRAVLWQAYLRCFRPGQRVLDLSCGTGIDALYLVQHGLRVVGLDISPGMIAQLKLKASRLGLRGQVEAHVYDLNQLGSWHAAPFDGMLSAFAGLNTLPDLDSLSRAAARLLKPEGHLIVHMLNRFSCWTWLDQARRTQGWAALRASRQGVFIAEVGGIPVRHSLYFPGEAYRRFFKPDFRLLRAYGLGAVRPLSASSRFPPALLEWLARLEGLVAGIYPFRNCGRFFVLEMQKRD